MTLDEALQALFDQWLAQPNAAAITRDATLEFFDALDPDELPAADGRTKQRFFEWLLLDLPLEDGRPIVEHLAPPPPAEPPAWHEELRHHRHDAWRIAEADRPGWWRLVPLGGGAPVELAAARHPEHEPTPGDLLVGRLLRREGHWMAFLQRVVNGGGRIHREYALGRRRVDLRVDWPLPVPRTTVIELKVIHRDPERTPDKRWVGRITRHQAQHDGQVIQVRGL